MIVPNGAGHLEIRELRPGWEPDDFEIARAMWLSKLGIKPRDKAKRLGIALGGPVPLSMFEQVSTYRDHQLDEAGVSEAECPRGALLETVMVPAAVDDLLSATRSLVRHAVSLHAIGVDDWKQQREELMAMATRLSSEATALTLREEQAERDAAYRRARELASEKYRRLVGEAEKGSE